MGKRFKKFAMIFFTCCYIFCVGLLVWQALTPGNESANISNSVGDQLNEIITSIKKPTAEKVNVSSLKIKTITSNGESIQPILGEGDYAYINIAVGQTVALNAKVEPSNATNPAVEYTASTECATVNQSGIISAVSEGECLITVTSKENGSLKDSILLKITNVSANGMQIVNKVDKLYKGQTHLVKYEFLPKNTTDKRVIWSVSNEEVISINPSGMLTALNLGSATVYAKWAVDESIQDSFEITIEEMPQTGEGSEEVEIEGISVENTSLTLKRGDTHQVTVSYTPSNTTFKGINWQSSNESVATISSSGVITAIVAGECVITAVSNTKESVKVQISLTVEERLSSAIALSFSGMSGGEGSRVLKDGSSGKISATLDDNVTVNTVIYHSSNESVATVSQDGVVNAVAPGKAVITVYSTDGKNRVENSVEIIVEALTFKDTMSNFYYWVRKSFGHFGAFLVLGGAASLMFLSYSKKGIASKLIFFAICMVSGFAVAGLTEILQLPIFTVGRYCSFSDVILDFSGYSVSTIGIFLVAFIVEKVRIIKYKSTHLKERK